MNSERLQVELAEANKLNDSQYHSFQTWKKDYFKKLKIARKALEKIERGITQFDHGQIVGSEEFERAWLECVEIARDALEAIRDK